jgi:predicted nucleotide-binding protein (sugar kinase/HSP70/actin superfamily)
MELPFDITYRGFTFRIMQSERHDNTIEVALLSKPYGFKEEINDDLIYKLFYYIQEEGFVDDETELD